MQPAGSAGNHSAWENKQMTNQPINDGGPAFPHTTQWDGITPAINCHGISMRDYFAAAALQGCLASFESTGTPYGYALIAYEYADAMLKAREEK
jgi:hypothetical protein